MPNFKKCDKDNICAHLAARIDESGRGFIPIDTIHFNPNTTLGNITFRGIAYKMNAKDKGLMLNFCPFCGGQPGNFTRD